MWICRHFLLALVALGNWSWVLAQEPPIKEIERLRATVEELRKQLEGSRHEAAAATAQLEEQRYLYRVALAQRAWQAGDIRRARELLNDCPSRLRQWEWFYLRRLVRGGLVTLDGRSCVAYSPDGKRLATAGKDHTIKVWDPDTGREVLTLKGHRDWVSAVVFSPDGKRLASGGSDGMVRVWDLHTGKELLTLRQYIWVAAVAFSPDGKRLASASGEGKDGKAADVKVWDATDGKSVLRIPAHGGQTLALAYSPDGRRLATGGKEGRSFDVKVWDTASGRQVLTLPGNAHIVLALAYSPDGKYFASGGLDQTVRVWNAATGKEVFWRGRPWPVVGVAFSPDSERLASAGGDEHEQLAGEVNVWDLGEGEEAFAIRGHLGQIRAVAYRPDGQRLGTAGGDGVLNIWDATGPQGGPHLQARSQRYPRHCLQPRRQADGRCHVRIRQRRQGGTARVACLGHGHGKGSAHGAGQEHVLGVVRGVQPGRQTPRLRQPVADRGPGCGYRQGGSPHQGRDRQRGPVPGVQPGRPTPRLGDGR
jgi:WD40 repeat protein